MKLISFIPEIKIQPNLGKIRVGAYFKNIGDKSLTYKISNENDEFYFVTRDNGKEVLSNKWDKSYVNELFNIGTWYLVSKPKDIKEIKIQPNTRYKVGDLFAQKNSTNEPMVITSIRDGNVYYDSIDGQWGKDGNYRSIKEFNKLINDNWFLMDEMGNLK